MSLAGQDAPFGLDLLFRSTGACPFTFHVEICEDLWVAAPPSSAGALAGAELLLNLSASNITIGKADTRRLLCASQSARCIAAYAYSAAGPGESTTDLAWDGQTAVFEIGALLAETARFPGDHALPRRRGPGPPPRRAAAPRAASATAPSPRHPAPRLPHGRVQPRPPAGESP